MGGRLTKRGRLNRAEQECMRKTESRRERYSRMRWTLAAFVLCLAMAAPLIVQATDYRYNFGGDACPGYRAVSPAEECAEAGGITFIHMERKDARPIDEIFYKVMDVATNTEMQHIRTVGLGQYSFVTNTVAGRNYKLWAARKFFWDPCTYVSGTWEP